MDGPLFPQHVIARKRDGFVLTRDEIKSFVAGATNGSWGDYQLSALLMAIFLKGMNSAETVALTDAMMHSGTVADLSSIKQPKADKHSTGGVGDKVSIHLAPMIAACGVAVPMISGRGLGHTGGTLDKLESIAGFEVRLSIPQYRRQIEAIGLALIGQTTELAPADRKLYALRDVTATVECIPLICASILSKKLSEGIDVLVLDVKYGRGAFMKDRDKARELAKALTEVAQGMGKPTRALLTSMEQPLGRSVGNALEVAESIACLKDQGPADTMEVTYALGSHMLVLAGACEDLASAQQKLQDSISSGAALEKFRAMVKAQGGNPKVADDPSLLPKAKVIAPFEATMAGYVQSVDALDVAIAALKLGAGRAKAEDKVDHAVGFDQLAKIGEPVCVGQTLCMIHAQSKAALAEARESLAKAITVGPQPVTAPRLIDELIE